MKRDSDLIRKLLLILEADIGTRPKMYPFEVNASKPFIDGHSDKEVYEHFLMLLDSPFLRGKRQPDGPVLIQELTWEGREFLDAIRGDSVWTKTKMHAEKIGGVGLGFMREIAKGVIKHELKVRLGIDAA